MIELIGSLFIFVGAVFLFAAALGVLRMPDSYNRIQTGTKASTLGTVLILIGLCFYHPDWTAKLILLVFFIFWTNPVSSHALARAAHRRHIHLAKQTVVDQLDEVEHPKQSESTLS